MKKISIILLVLISFFFQSCGDLREIQINDISVTPVDKEEIVVGDEIELKFKYLSVDKTVSQIGIQIDVKRKDETETYPWKYLGYNPFVDFEDYRKRNSEYIVEKYTYDYPSECSIYFHFKGSKALSGDETLSLRVNEPGEYCVHIYIYDKTPVATSLVWNCDSEITFKVNPATEESTPAEE